MGKKNIYEQKAYFVLVTVEAPYILIILIFNYHSNALSSRLCSERDNQFIKIQKKFLIHVNNMSLSVCVTFSLLFN